MFLQALSGPIVPILRYSLLSYLCSTTYRYPHEEPDRTLLVRREESYSRSGGVLPTRYSYSKRSGTNCSVSTHIQFFQNPLSPICLSTFRSSTITNMTRPPGRQTCICGKCGDHDICIKFVRRYSVNAHEKCSMLGFAPTLRAFSKITGDWCVVAMDCVGGEYEELDDAWSKLTAEA